jgi:hypothetical protein
MSLKVFSISEEMESTFSIFTSLFFCLQVRITNIKTKNIFDQGLTKRERDGSHGSEIAYCAQMHKEQGYD